ncbi:MAG TPA: chemotaxis protein CheA [Bryobacteraceae bacterium]|nr:chemotaxis protein CheA [Bryobacteraceae bacterium]
MEIDLSQFRETFFQEAAEHLESMETELLSLRAGEASAETLNAIFRGAHSIKAGAGTFGFEAMARFTHVLESLLDRLRNSEMELSPPCVELVLRSVDVLRALVDAASRDTEPPPSWETVIEELNAALGSPAAPASALATVVPGGPQATGYEIRFEPAPDLFRMGLDPFLVLRDLAQLGSLSCVADVSRLPSIETMDPETCYLRWRLRLQTSAPMNEIRDAFAFVEDVAVVSIEPITRAAAAPQLPHETPAAGARTVSREGSIRVATAKVDRLIDLVGELVIAESMATQIMNEFTIERLPMLQQSLADIARYTRELQDRAMRIRMLPIGSIFARFQRLVHDTAGVLGKQVSLEISGEETELDKGVVECIADPLTHLVRNAVDHGIESPAERLQAGKPAAGSVRLHAYHQGGNVIIEVSDDGRGLDTARIRDKARARGLIGAAEDLSDEQIHALIFRPGFSTADQVSDLSGRGVGMDVVKKSVDALGGVVALRTVHGHGSTVRIKLPLTLAILDGLLLRLGAETYVVPLVSIVESVRMRAGQVRNVAGRGEVIPVRGEPLPLIRLDRIFQVPGHTDGGDGLVVIVEHDGGRWALLVDELLGQQQVVVKSLETNFRKVEGVTGATVLGDGRAALILDIAGIVGMSRGKLLPTAA